MPKSKEILKNHNIAGCLILPAIVLSYLLGGIVPQEVVFTLFGILSYAILQSFHVPFFSNNERLAKFVSILIMFVGLAYISQKYFYPEIAILFLIAFVPLTIFFVFKLYMYIFVDARR